MQIVEFHKLASGDVNNNVTSQERVCLNNVSYGSLLRLYKEWPQSP